MLLSYLKRHIKIILLFLIFGVIFAAVFSLYNLAVEAVLYALVLCALVGAVMFGFGFLRYRARHRRLLEILKNIELGVSDLPEPCGGLEEDYQEILRMLWAQSLKIRSDAAGAQRDMTDYYTLWAHQIKTPIAAMRLLLSETENAENSLLLAELFKIEQYVEMVLQYVRLGSDSRDLLIKKLDLDEIIRGCLRKYARLFSLKKLEFSFEETGLLVLTDEKWLSFVIEQLFSNSLKYTQSGKISIFAEGTALVIEDTGIGIRAEDLPRVWEKGYTGSGGRADKKSTGIGLFLCKNVCKTLGHRLEISSRVGVGTRVKIFLDREETLYE
ncbi:MAG: sensor histidine kinase [Oscillospiraceae bacterium]